MPGSRCLRIASAVVPRRRRYAPCKCLRHERTRSGHLLQATSLEPLTTSPVARPGQSRAPPPAGSNAVVAICHLLASSCRLPSRYATVPRHCTPPATAPSGNGPCGATPPRRSCGLAAAALRRQCASGRRLATVRAAAWSGTSVPTAAVPCVSERTPSARRAAWWHPSRQRHR
jgi:hypothetical protein